MNSSLLELHEALNYGFYIDNSTEKIDNAKLPDIQVNRQSGSISMSGRTGVMAMINNRTVNLPADAVVRMLALILSFVRFLINR